MEGRGDGKRKDAFIRKANTFPKVSRSPPLGFVSWNDNPRLPAASGKMDILTEHIMVVN